MAADPTLWDALVAEVDRVADLLRIPYTTSSLCNASGTAPARIMKMDPSVTGTDQPVWMLPTSHADMIVDLLRRAGCNPVPWVQSPGEFAQALKFVPSDMPPVPPLIPSPWLTGYQVWQPPARLVDLLLTSAPETAAPPLPQECP